MSRLSAVPDEPDQVARLEKFRATYPGIPVDLRYGRMPSATVGYATVRRPTLKQLLDRLDELTGDETGTAR